MEALKVAMGKGPDEVLVGRMLLYDASTSRFRTVKLRNRNSSCQICGDGPTPKTLKAVDGISHDGCALDSKDLYPDLPQLTPDNFVSCQVYKGFMLLSLQAAAVV